MVAGLKEGLHVCASHCSSGEGGRPRVGVLEPPVKVSPERTARRALQLHFLESLRVLIAGRDVCRSRLNVTTPHPLYVHLVNALSNSKQ